jgi:hypothetical protein
MTRHPLRSVLRVYNGLSKVAMCSRGATPRFMRRVEAATRRHIENCSSVSRIFYDIDPSKVVRFDHLHYGVEVDYA